MRSIIFSLAFLLFSGNTVAEDDAKQEIVKRCNSQMGGYGASMVKACIEKDLEAVSAINKLPDKYESIVNDCMKTMREYGFSMVKSCADQGVRAEKSP